MILFSLFLVYLFLDPLFQLFINHDNNLSNQNIVYEEDYQNLKKEYDQLLKFTTENPENTVSKVIFRNPLTFFEEMKILKGQKEHIEKGSLVLNENGLVGVVKEVYEHSSLIELLPNKNTKIAVDIGTTHGLLESQNDQLIIKNLPMSAPIEVGMPINTSSYSLLTPNILVGVVKEVYPTNQNLSYEVIVEPNVDFENLNYVIIKKREANE